MPRSHRQSFPTRRDTSEERRPDFERYLTLGRLAQRLESDDPEILGAYLYAGQAAAEASWGEALHRPRPRRNIVTDEDIHSLRLSSVSVDPSRNMSSNQPQRDLQRRFSREPAPRRTEALPSLASLSSAAALPPLRSLGSRRVSNNTLPSSSSPGGRLHRQRPERILERQRTSEHRHSNPTSFEDLEYDLDDANTQLRALLDYTNTTIMSAQSPSENPHTPHHDQVEDSRRVKRRKLDSERGESTCKGFRYGRYGAIESGFLKMEIETCDGGFYNDSQHNLPESILNSDKNVYCTKGNRCNIVLRHQGATVFTLSELMIRAPGPKFTSPVREGMVFISMESNAILTRTAQYQVQYVTSQSSTAERENEIPIVSVRHYEDGSVARLRRSRIYNHARMEDTTEHKTAVFPVEKLAFPVTVVTDFISGDCEENRPQLRRRPAPRIGTLPFESDSSEDGENGLGSWDDFNRFDGEATPPPNYPRRTQEMTLSEAAEASQLATQEAVQAVGGELLAPHAKFFIEKGKNRCTMKFDPPVSGRYILLKMYHPSENIDIQGVFAKGFAGPRYFPSVQLR